MSEKNKKMFSWMSPKLEVRETGKYDGGVFARSGVKKNDLLAVFGGYVMTIKEELSLPKKFQDTGVQIGEDLVINSGKKKEVTDFFNHSCSPNVGFNGQIFMVAMRDVKRGEEITFDYAMCLHKAKGIKSYKFKCLCGSKNCRGYVTENDWKILDLQKKYDGYFQYFLQEKINKKNS